jgi:phosphomannomutase
MTLIKSISGIRGTIGGEPGDNLTPLDAVKFASAYGKWIKEASGKKAPVVVIGRDARLSGAMIQALVQNTLIGMGCHVIDLGLSTTPTVEIAVTAEHADGGIILTASHNPKEWNALKLLNHNGEFLDGVEGQKILDTAAAQDFNYATVNDLGTVRVITDYIDRHILDVINMPLTQVDAINAAGFKVVVDGVNSTGGIAVPALLKALGVEVVELYCEPTGHFPHNPEPLKEHLGDLAAAVVAHNAHLGITVDPDVDRLAFMDERGEMFGEEYTLVACADYVLGHKKGNTVSNLSSSRALRDVTENHGGTYYAAAVGEVNVVQKMKEVQAVIGGEGNGGIIYPESHYGRDALVGIAMFLSLLTERRLKVSELRASYPAYFMSKKKVELIKGMPVDVIMNNIATFYKDEDITAIDGVKIDFEKAWVHMRKSNTEPIIRIYTEALTQQEADALATRFIAELEAIAQKHG